MQVTLLGKFKIKKNSPFSQIDSIIFKLSKKLTTETQTQQNIYPIDQIKLIQSFIRGLIQRKKYKIMLKQVQYRKHVLMELIETERKYVSDLKLIIELVIQPIRKLKILSQEDILKVFVNIEAICILNSQFHNALQSLLPYRPYKLISPAILNFIPFFKIYFDYCKLFSIERVQNCREEQVINLINLIYKPQFNLFITQLEDSQKFRGLNLSAFLVKPVQRLPQYVLLFKDFFRHMDKEDRDYKGISDVLIGFTKVNANINNMIIKVIKNCKMFELQKLFGDPNNLNLLSSSRKFLHEETLNVISKNSEKPVILYIMNDLLLISERQEQSEQLYKTVHLSCNSFCKDIDSNYFHNLFGVIGKQRSITFSCETADGKQKLMELIDKLIEDLKQKNQQKQNVGQKVINTHNQFLLKVNVIGTEERSQWISKYTVYIIFIEINQSCIKLFLRYRELVELQKIIHQYYPNVELPKLPTTNWLTNLSAKVIESRKILIEDFLQTLFQSEKIKQQPQLVLQYLNLPSDFYSLNQEEQQKTLSPTSPNLRMSLSEQKSPLYQNLDQFSFSQFNSQMIISKEEHNRNSYSSNIFSACDILRTSRQQSKIFNRSLSQNSKACQKYSVSINLLDKTSITVDIDKFDKFGDLLEKTAKQINLQAYLDFRFVLKNEKGKTIRVLDEDEIVIKCMQLSQTNKIMDFISQLVSSKVGNLYLIKYLYLPDIQEQQDYLSDKVRLDLIVAQIFYDITHDNTYLTFTDFPLYCAFYLLIKKIKIANAESVQYLWIKQFLPERISKVILTTNWIEAIFHFYKKVQSMAAQAKFENETWNSKQEISQQRIDDEQIYKFLLLKSFSLNQLYGITLFNNRQGMKDKIQFFNSKIYKLVLPVNTMIGISLNKFMIVSVGSHRPLFIQPITNLEQFHFYPDNLRFEITQLSLSFSFITKQVFEIQRLINEYEIIRSLQDQICIIDTGEDNSMMQDSIIEQTGSSIKQMQILKRVI